MARLLTDKDVAAALGVHRATVWRWAADGRLPAPLKVAGKTARWRAEDVDTVIAKAEAEREAA